MTARSGWENFYVIVGSSAGALIGLQFVVMTLIANMPITRDDAQAGNTFTTPTVVHSTHPPARAVPRRLRLHP